MATQGLVSVVRGPKVVMKVITGSDGMNARRFANALRARWPLDARATYLLAIEMDFGCRESLVVMTETGEYHELDEDLHPRYRQTFGQPMFNPRWECGLYEYKAVITV